MCYVETQISFGVGHGGHRRDSMHRPESHKQTKTVYKFEYSHHRNCLYQRLKAILLLSSMPELRIRSRTNFKEERTLPNSSRDGSLPPSLSSGLETPACASPIIPLSQQPYGTPSESTSPSTGSRGPHNYRQILNLKHSVKTILILAGVLTMFITYKHWLRQAPPTSNRKPSATLIPAESKSSYPISDTHRVYHRQAEPRFHLPPHRIPVVYRTILEKLEGSRTPARHGKSPASPNQWPPSVTRIPEASTTRAHLLQPHICDNSLADSCRFLLPLRMSGQEYSVGSHIEQLAKLALGLNRTLVLPNVGKSRAGACYRYDFEVYYDQQSLQRGLGVSVIKMDVLKRWAGPRALTTAQIVTLSTQPSRNVTFPIITNEDTIVQVDHFRDTQSLELPSCFSRKFPFLKLGDPFPHLIISPDTAKDKLIGNSIVYALSDKNEDLKSAIRAHNQDLPKHAPKALSPLRPDVLLVNWALPHPVFQPSLVPVLQYSSDLTVLAQQLAPSGPYLAIYWNMESVSSDLLELCAHALVDKISSLLLEASMSSGIEAVWFASDYPYPLFQTAPYSRWTVAGDVQFNAFNNIEQQAEAVDILKKAFENGSDLSRWKLTDFIEEVSHMSGENILLQDKGALGILDRIIISRAALFVTANAGTCGGTRCVSALRIANELTTLQSAGYPDN